MKAHRTLVFALAVALQLLAWREAVPVCASMAHCTGMPAEQSPCDPPATITGTAACCTGGSVVPPVTVSPMPERVQSVAPVVSAAALVLAPPLPPLAADRGRATAAASPPLPPLLGSCILRI